ncbi:thioredoxin reductase [Gordonia spumicola]|uniref:Thioredoxin reductase n=1 Tax=Gordonia spumicola TaxID=589161 RepID=A0A7I9V4S3_9ACTN|nr:NAD(P)/FAD-dependent oxidoreductase [Gordonia spumicola]GEE00237.1 thioredoxin reductase [Gordonia spumicola]GEE04166.1 thioredoxin reductase [Gordonia spumicola]
MNATAADTQNSYDVVIVGGGAAGLTAAQVLGRARRRVLVVDGGRPRNAPAAHMHGYLGHDGLPPATLVEIGRDEARAYGVQFVDGDVARVVPCGVEPGYVVTLGGGRDVRTSAIIVATGLVDHIPEIPGLRERWGSEVLHCPYCHGYEVRDRRLAVLGGLNRDASVHQALLLPLWSRDVVFFPNGADLSDAERTSIRARGVEIVDGEVAAFDGEAIEMADGQSVPRDVVFVGPRFDPNDDILRSLGCDVASHGFVSVDSRGATSVPGVFAAGNVVNPKAQVITAAGEGSAAAIAVNQYLLHGDVEAAIASWSQEGSPRR